MNSIEIQGPLLNQATVCQPILRALPDWFGIEDAIVQYVEQIDTLPTLIAIDKNNNNSDNNPVVGFLSIKKHFATSAEIYVMGILHDYHRKGIGKLLTIQAEKYLKDNGILHLQVKTLSESRVNEHYAKTRQFYQAMGFHPLEEFKTLWDEVNPCLLMIKSLY